MSNKVIKSLDRRVTVIYGGEGGGKSTLASQWPNSVFMATEPGLSDIETEIEPMLVNNWVVFLAACKAVIEGKYKGRIPIIDTVDKLAVFATDHICTEHSVSHVSEIGSMGKGYDMVRGLLERKLSKLVMSCPGLVMIGHDTQVEEESKVRKWKKTTIRLTGKQKGVILDMADNVWLMDTEMDDDKNEFRVIRTMKSLYWSAKTRGGYLPETVKIKEGVNNYEMLASYFKGKEGSK